MPVLRIAMDGWMDGCNARFKDCCGQKQKLKKNKFENNNGRCVVKFV